MSKDASRLILSSPPPPFLPILRLGKHSRPARPRKEACARTAHPRISIGNIILVVPRPTKTEIQENVRRSTEALNRALVRLTRPGIRLRPERGIPLFQLDEDNPDLLIWDLDSKRERGLFQDGDFKTIS